MNYNLLIDEDRAKEAIAGLDYEALAEEINETLPTFWPDIRFEQTATDGELGINAELPHYVHETDFFGTDHGRISADDYRSYARQAIVIIEEIAENELTTFDDFRSATDNHLYGAETYHGWQATAPADFDISDTEFQRGTMAYAYGKAKVLLALYDELDL